MVTAAAVANEKKRRQGLYHAVQDVVAQVSPTTTFRTAYWQAASDPCLQIADYCSWAIQRKWERGDERSYVLIKDKIQSEFQFFRGEKG